MRPVPNFVRPVPLAGSFFYLETSSITAIPLIRRAHAHRLHTHTHPYNTKMDKLLNWSLAQNDPATAAKAGAPDPELLAKLFGAKKDDATLMLESISIVQNDEVSKEDKLTALDNFEMLIENLDNANNIENLKLWPTLISLIDNSDAELSSQVCGIIGTSVQNNAKCQDDFSNYEDGYTKLIKNLELAEGGAEDSFELKNKSLFALSNLIRNNSKSFEQFTKRDGFQAISKLLLATAEFSKKNEKLKLRILSLLSSILTVSNVKNSAGGEEGDEIFKFIEQNNIINEITLLVSAKSSISYIDTSLNFLSNLLTLGYKFTDAENDNIKSTIAVVKKDFSQVVDMNDYKNLLAY